MKLFESRSDSPQISPEFIDRVIYSFGRNLSPEELSEAQGLTANLLARYASTISADTRDQAGLDKVLSTLSPGMANRVAAMFAEEAPPHWLLPTRERVAALSGSLALRAETSGK